MVEAGGSESERAKGDVTPETETGMMHFEDGGKVYEPRKAGYLYKTERKRIFPWCLQKKHNPDNTLTLDSDLQNHKEIW